MLVFASLAALLLFKGYDSFVAPHAAIARAGRLANGTSPFDSPSHLTLKSLPGIGPRDTPEWRSLQQQLVKEVAKGDAGKVPGRFIPLKRHITPDEFNQIPLRIAVLCTGRQCNAGPTGSPATRLYWKGQTSLFAAIHIVTRPLPQGFEYLFYGDSITERWRGTEMGKPCSNKDKECPECAKSFKKRFGSFRTALLAISGELPLHTFSALRTWLNQAAPAHSSLSLRRPWQSGILGTLSQHVMR